MYELFMDFAILLVATREERSSKKMGKGNPARRRSYLNNGASNPEKFRSK